MPYIRGKDDLINVSKIRLASVHASYALDPMAYDLVVYYDGTEDYSIVDRFSAQEEAGPALDWFGLFLTGEIEMPVWIQGRTDALEREGYPL